jgi:hypothetical protein
VGGEIFLWLKGMEALHTSSYHEVHFEIKGNFFWVGPKNMKFESLDYFYVTNMIQTPNQITCTTIDTHQSITRRLQFTQHDAKIKPHIVPTLCD